MSTSKQFEQKGAPIVSVDCKKKELIGNFKNHGREWQAKGEDTCVNVYDFLSLASGKAVPYGIYDLVHHRGFVHVGIDHDSAEFAVESIRRGWQSGGNALYPDQKELLITADGGGSNGVRNRLWKKKLQEFANEERLTITVVHYPPATSKWNKIEHRLFSFISINWRAKPLISLEVVLELLSHTTTKEGLAVTAVKDNMSTPLASRSLRRNWLPSTSLGIPFMGNGTTRSGLSIFDHFIFGSPLSFWQFANNILVESYQISADFCLFSNFMADFSKLGIRRFFVPSQVFTSQMTPKHTLILKNPHYL